MAETGLGPPLKVSVPPPRGVPSTVLTSPLRSEVVAVGAFRRLSRMLTVLSPRFVRARSGRLSLLKSPVASEMGMLPAGKSVPVVLNVPSPLPARMLAVWLPELTTARSRLPSPLKSSVVMPCGEPADGYIGAGVIKPPLPLLMRMLS
jgi:hypothetical protein